MKNPKWEEANQLSWTRDKQGQTKLVVSPAFKSLAQTTQPCSLGKEKTILLRKELLRQSTWWLNTHFRIAMSVLSLTLEMNVSLHPQSRMFKFYHPVWFTKHRLMNIHKFPLHPSLLSFLNTIHIILAGILRNGNVQFSWKVIRVIKLAHSGFEITGVELGILFLEGNEPITYPALTKFFSTIL